MLLVNDVIEEYEKEKDRIGLKLDNIEELIKLIKGDKEGQ